MFVTTLCVATMGLCLPQQTFAMDQEPQTEEVVAVDEAAVEEGEKYTFSDFLSDALEVLIVILVIGAILAWIGHMVYERFFRKPTPTYTVEGFQRLRTEQGLSSEATNEEADRVCDLLNGAKSGWYHDSEYNIDWIPKKKVYKHTMNSINEVIALKPTSTLAVDSLNELIEEMNYMNKRTFDVSKPLLWTVGIVSVLMCILMGSSEGFGAVIGMAAMFGINIGVYLLACQAPNWLALKREEKGRGKSSSGLIAGVLGMIAGAKTYKTVTKWSDGTTTTDTDNSETGVALIIALVVFVFLTFFLWVIAIWNYLRNYVLHF